MIVYRNSNSSYSKNYVSMLDFTNEAMIKWYQQQMYRAVKTIGYHGWMYDYGKYTPPYSNASNGDNGNICSMCNRWSLSIHCYNRSPAA